MSNQTKFGLKNKNFPEAKLSHHPGGATAFSKEVMPGALDLSTHSGASKKDPFGPVPKM